MVDISVLMPCHNERCIIRDNINETVTSLKRSNNGSFELVVIDDCSSDGTFDEIYDCAKNNGYVKLVKLERNLGKGNALRKGFEHSSGRYICFLDGDLDIHPRLIKVLYEYMETEEADVVIGSKRHPQSEVNYPFNRRILSGAYQGFVKTIFGMSIRDSQVGLKLFKREVLEDIFPLSFVKEYAFDIELLVNAHNRGYRIIEAPIEMDFINTVGSDVNIKAVARMFMDTCGIFYRLNLLNYYNNGHGEPEETREIRRSTIDAKE